jgi:hypothetical protein
MKNSDHFLPRDHSHALMIIATMAPALMGSMLMKGSEGKE